MEEETGISQKAKHKKRCKHTRKKSRKLDDPKVRSMQKVQLPTDRHLKPRNKGENIVEELTSVTEVLLKQVSRSLSPGEGLQVYV